MYSSKLAVCHLFPGVNGRLWVDIPARGVYIKYKDNVLTGTGDEPLRRKPNGLPSVADLLSLISKS